MEQSPTAVEPRGQLAGSQLRGLRARAADAEREAVLQARRDEDAPPAPDDVLFDIETHASRYG